MKYFQWLGEITGVDFPSLHYQEKWWMVEGRPVDEWDETVTGTYVPSRVDLSASSPEFNYGLAINGWPIFSPKLRRFMDSNASDLVQFLPFRLRFDSRNNREIDGFCIGQFLKLVDCLDRTRTTVRENWEPINEYGDFDIQHPSVLKAGAIGEEKLFRVLGDCGCVVIREDLKDEIEEFGFRGQRFENMETS